MNAVRRRPLEVASRRVVQDAKLAIRDVYDAIVELVTNSDDRYQILGEKGRVEIELGRRGKGQPSILRVRDFADGMTTEQMNRKLGRIGGRVSGMEVGKPVRGTNSRGAKDIAALGTVTFESIAGDGRMHTCRIFSNLEYEAEDSREILPEVRKRLGIGQGTGTVVTIEIERNHRIPKIDTLVPNVARLVRLRDIVWQERTRLVARGLKADGDRVVGLPRPAGRKRVSKTFAVPGYPGAKAKLVVFRARKRFSSERSRFRLGGILVKSRHAIHEATLFDRGLEWDPHAQWFFGRLTCEAIDDLWNEYDERQARGDPHPPENPVPILDPSRKTGLTPDHPFVEALYARALAMLRPLVEEERTREERERARSVESQKTRKRLDALEKAANQFMEDFSDEEMSRDPKSRERGSQFQIRGYSLTPQYAQVVRGHSFKCWLTVRSEAFPEIGEGQPVRVRCLTDEIRADATGVPLARLEAQEGVLRATWSVKGLEETVATGLEASVGPIKAESTVAVLASEADRYSQVAGLQFERKSYRIRGGSRRSIRLLAPVGLARAAGREFDLELSSDDFRISGPRRLVLSTSLGIALCKLKVALLDDEAAPTKVTARLGEHEAETELRAAPAAGSGIVIKLEDVDHGALRYRWNRNVLEIGARHPSLKRYLGPKSEQYPEQDALHFRVLLAEVVAEALCARRLQGNIDANPRDFEGSSWDEYYRHYARMMSEFLPKAHGLMAPGADA
ncbi:hypothetical protein [Candidatus Palauibacter sp.]|uniref:hypothetical protein n=1 Tax=Candidatus Palauibacter sp. TaxID=3101350 RepID=UPI003B51EC91